MATITDPKKLQEIAESLGGNVGKSTGSTTQQDPVKLREAAERFGGKASPLQGGATFDELRERGGKPVEEKPKREGFFKRTARSIFKPPVTLATRPFQAIESLISTIRDPLEEPDLDVNLPFFGKIEAPESGKDVLRDFGRALETVALGLGVGAAGTIGKQTLKGAVVQAAKTGTKAGAKAGALSGAGSDLELRGQFDAGTVVNTILSTALGTATGGALGAVGGLGGKVVRSVGKKALRKFPVSGKLEKLKDKIELEDAIEATRPILSKKEEIQAIGSRRGTTRGLFRKKVAIEPSKRDKEVAEAVRGIIRKSAPETENIARIADDVTKIDKSITDGIKNNDAIFNNLQLRSALKNAKEESRVIFAGDKTLENRYDAVTDELFRNLEKNNLSNLFQARKRFDAVVRKKFPRTFDGSPGDNVQRNAILDVRRQVNEFIADNLKEGSKFKSSLRREHLMLEAIENLAEKAQQRVPKKGGRKILNFVIGAVAGGALSSLGVAAIQAGSGK